MDTKSITTHHIGNMKMNVLHITSRQSGKKKRFFSVLLLLPLAFVTLTLLIKFSAIASENKKIMNQTDVVYTQVQKLLDQGKVNKAQAVLQQISKENKRDWHAPNLLGNIALGAGRFTDAEKNYFEALNRDPSQAEIHNNFGVLYLKTNKGQKALQSFLLAIQLEPGNPQAAYNLAQIYLANGNLQKAGQYLQTAANATPEDVTIQFELISTLLRQGRLKEAAIQCQIVVNHHPQSVGVRTDLGFLLLHYNIIDDAAGQFAKAVNIDKSSARAWYGLGLASRRLGQVGTALTAFGKAATLDQTKPDYLTDLAMTQITVKTEEAFTAAEDNLHQAIGIDPNNTRTLYLTGIFYTETEDIQQAINYFGQALDLGLHTPNFYLTYGKALISGGQEKEGRKLLRKVTTQPDSSEQQRKEAEELLQ